MIRVSVKRKENEIYGITCTGHADYSDGNDVVCAAVSVLMINTINAMDTYTDDEVLLKEVDEGSGTMEVSFPKGLSHDGRLLADTLILGLTEISKEYGKRYVTFEERKV